MARDAAIEKGNVGYAEGNSPNVISQLGAKTIAEATGRGGETQRGLKSRHIQFL